jgi:hypothetical protein
MTSDDDVHRLRREGFSIRAIADRLGLSRMKDEPALFDPERVLAEPFTFCGVDTVLIIDRRDDPRAATEERWLDGNGRSCSVLDIWRYYTHRAGDHGDYETGERVRADMERQRAAWGERGATPDASSSRAPARAPARARRVPGCQPS